MLKIYLKQTLRDLRLNKGYFITNLLGLIIGTAAFTLIVLWIQTETSYDKFHQHANDIYRVDYLLYEEEVKCWIIHDFIARKALFSTGIVPMKSSRNESSCMHNPPYLIYFHFRFRRAWLIPAFWLWIMPY